MADTFTANLNLTLPEVGASADSWGTKLNADQTVLDAMLAGILYGLTLSTAGSSSTFGVAAGAASGMVLSSAYTKTTGSWAVGSGNGALDSGTIANSTWYHVWLIQRTDTGVVDVLVSTSATSPALPTNYSRKRMIGSMLTDSSAQWTKFLQRGDWFQWTAVPDTLSGFLPAANTPVSKIMTVPTGIRVMVRLSIVFGNTGSIRNDSLNVYPTDCVDGVNSPNGNNVLKVPVNDGLVVGVIDVLCDISGQVRIEATTNNSPVQISTRGFYHPRGKY